MPAVLKILRVDMDAFYAAIEALDHPEWRGLPLVVGAPPDRRGVVSTCSYETRQYGIHSAMPSRTAGKLCPHAIFVPVRMERYAEVSSWIMARKRAFPTSTPLPGMNPILSGCASACWSWRRKSAGDSLRRLVGRIL